MPRFTIHCWSCSDVIETDGVYRSDHCAKCGQDLKVCKACRHYDANASNECREPAAEYVYEKTRANYCGYYEPRQDRIEVVDEVADARAKLDALFKK